MLAVSRHSFLHLAKSFSSRSATKGELYMLPSKRTCAPFKNSFSKNRTISCKRARVTPKARALTFSDSLREERFLPLRSIETTSNYVACYRVVAAGVKTGLLRPISPKQRRYGESPHQRIWLVLPSPSITRSRSTACPAYVHGNLTNLSCPAYRRHFRRNSRNRKA